MKDLEDEKFRRLTGIKRAVFNKMISILKEANKQKKLKENKLSLENILMTLEYIRKYRRFYLSIYRKNSKNKVNFQDCIYTQVNSKIGE